MNNKENVPIEIRKFDKNIDEKLIYNSYLKSQRNYFDPVSNSVYYKEQPKILDKLIKLYGINVACNPDILDQLYAWICFDSEKEILHFAYTKEPFRKFGIFTRLLESYKPSSKVILVSHFGKALMYCNKYTFVFYPYALYGMNI